MDGIEDVIDAGWKARREGHHGEAERSLLEVIEITRRTGAKPQLIRALKALAHVVRDVGQDERALTLYEEAVTLSREEGDIGLLAHTMRHLGDVQMDAGRLVEADLCYREALSLYRSAASPPALDFANALRPAALLKERQGDRALAPELWTEAKDLYEAVGVQRGVDECARHLALL